MVNSVDKQNTIFRGAAIAQWKRLRLPPQVRVLSSPSTLLSFIVNFVQYLSCEKNENKQKEARVWPIKNMTLEISDNMNSQEPTSA